MHSQNCICFAHIAKALYYLLCNLNLGRSESKQAQKDSSSTVIDKQILPVYFQKSEIFSQCLKFCPIKNRRDFFNWVFFTFWFLKYMKDEHDSRVKLLSDKSDLKITHETNFRRYNLHLKRIRCRYALKMKNVRLKASFGSNF